MIPLKHRITFVLPPGRDWDAVEDSEEGVALVGGPFPRHDRHTYQAPALEGVELVMVLSGGLVPAPFTVGASPGVTTVVVPLPGVSAADAVGLVSAVFPWVDLLVDVHGALVHYTTANITALDFPVAVGRAEQVYARVRDGQFVVETYAESPREVFVPKGAASPSVELGLFHINQDASSPDDLALEGITYAGQIRPAMFHVVPRHLQAEAALNATLVATGLHPTVQLSLNATDAPAGNCELYLQWNLPKSVFLDPYQLPAAIRPILHSGNLDLELPEYAVDEWGQLMFAAVDLSSPVEVKLHLRYQQPGHDAVVEVPLPHVFWGCDHADPVQLNTPFDVFGAGYQHLFTNDTVFHHVQPGSTMAVDVPAGSASGTTGVVTTAAVLLASAYLLRKLVG